ncbi:phage late control D family protein [Brevibacillus dissolubilis]|uniref:phage late control D family protein n=1 Tax=Brevibacillus dissolubilis TaxID=1844116 RepID=UPI001116F3F9|nr:phage late control D family protein [Brevibacillus dissolubilis]
MTNSVLFTQSSFTFGELSSKYKNFFAPAFEVLIENENMVKKGYAISQVSVRTVLGEEADTASFTVDNAYDIQNRTFTGTDNYFAPGKELIIRMGYVDKLETVFIGMIKTVRYDYAQDGPPQISVDGIDLSFTMMSGNHFKQWNEMQDSDVVSDIASLYLSDVQTDATQTQKAEINQYDMSDYRYLLYLAMKNNYDFYVVGKTIYFKQAPSDNSSTPTAVTTLEWQKTLLSFSTEVNLSNQVDQVVVQWWNPDTRKLIEGKSTTVKKLGTNSTTGKDLIGALNKPNVKYVQRKVKDQDEASKLANAILNKISMGLLQGSGSCLGVPEIRAALYLSFNGLGASFNQPMRITSATHRIGRSGYLIDFEVEGNAI